LPYKLKICRIREVDAKITIFIRSIELSVCLFSVVVVIVVVVVVVVVAEEVFFLPKNVRA